MRSAIIGALLGLGSTAYAVGTTTCKGDLCYSMNIPDTSTSSTGTVYFQISGPTSYAWIGMGTGSGMSGSKMFLIYQSANGQNITLSPRTANGHNTPSPDSSTQATLLEGSGISGGKMVANIRCDSCSTSQSSWIYAANSGSLKSDSQAASIQQHQNSYGQMSLDTSAAKGGSSTNPFLSSTPSSTSGSSNSGTACRSNSGNNNLGSNSGSPTSSSGFGWGPFGGSRPTNFPPFQSGSFSKRAGNDDCTNGGSSFSQNGSRTAEQKKMMLMAHGIMAGLAFAVLFPFGAISIRLFSFPGLVWFHAGIQILTQIIFIISFALGVTYAREAGLMMKYHPIIGIVVFALCLIQPVLGQMHHRAFKQVGRRTAWSHGHIWLGRIIITLGIINGGLGFLLAQNTNVGPIAYAIVAAIFYVAYLGAVIIGERRRQRALPPKYEESPRGSGRASPREFYGGRQQGGFEMGGRDRH